VPWAEHLGQVRATTATKSAAKKSEGKKAALKSLKETFETRLKTGANKWFFKKLRF